MDEINNEIIQILPEEERIYKSIDSVINDEDSINYPTEVLNSMEFSGIPSHRLKLKVGAPILMLRNLKQPGLCNGTRLRKTKLSNYTIIARILTGPERGEDVLIPRIPMGPSNIPFSFRQLQLPIKLANAFSINRA